MGDHCSACALSNLPIYRNAIVSIPLVRYRKYEIVGHWLPTDLYTPIWFASYGKADTYGGIEFHDPTYIPEEIRPTEDDDFPYKPLGKTGVQHMFIRRDIYDYIQGYMVSVEARDPYYKTVSIPDQFRRRFIYGHTPMAKRLFNKYVVKPREKELASLHRKYLKSISTGKYMEMKFYEGEENRLRKEWPHNGRMQELLRLYGFMVYARRLFVPLGKAGTAYEYEDHGLMRDFTRLIAKTCKREQS